MPVIVIFSVLPFLKKLFFALLMVLSEKTSGVFEPSVVSEITKEERGITIRRNDTTK